MYTHIYAHSYEKVTRAYWFRPSFFVFLLTRASLFVLVFCVFFSQCLVISTSAVNWLERLIPKMTYYVLSGTLNSTHSLTASRLTLIFYLLIIRRGKHKRDASEHVCWIAGGFLSSGRDCHPDALHPRSVSVSASSDRRSGNHFHL